jgi:hypothetical protein
MSVSYNLVGQQFGRLTVNSLSRARRSTSRVKWWNCKCECGGKALVRTARLIAKKEPTRSCGCLKITHKNNDRNRGANHYKAQKAIQSCGEWIPSTSPWAVRVTRIVSFAKKNNIKVGFKSISEFAQYARDIAPERCPVFGFKMITGTRYDHRKSPSIDKIIPSKGYVRGNIQIISMMANAMKQNATPKQLKQFAHWVLANN